MRVPPANSNYLCSPVRSTPGTLEFSPISCQERGLEQRERRPSSWVCPVPALSQRSAIKADLPVYAELLPAASSALLGVGEASCSCFITESAWKLSSTVGLKLRETGNCCLHLLLVPPTFNFPLYGCWSFSHRAITVHVPVKSRYSSHTSRTLTGVCTCCTTTASIH